METVVRKCVRCETLYIPRDDSATHCSPACASAPPFPSCRVCGTVIRPGARRRTICGPGCEREAARALTQRRRAELKKLGHRRDRSGEKRRSRTTERPCTICQARITVPRVRLCGPACIEEAQRRNRRRWKDENPDIVRSARQADRARRRAARVGAMSETYDRLEIADRDKWKCSICGLPISKAKQAPDPDSLAIDHIIPLSIGGHDVRSNVTATHLLCNVRKGNRATARGQQLRLIG